MISLFIHKEIVDQFKSTRFVITFSVIMVLIILGFYMGAENYHTLRSAYEAGIQQHRSALAENTSWGDVEHEVMLPPEPLSVLVNGISNDIGRRIEITRQTELNNIDSRYGDEPLFAVFRYIDLEFIFTIVLTLFAIVFAFDAINGERERGTLELVFAQSVSRASFMSGKMIGMFVTLLIPILLAVLIGSLLLVVKGVPMSPGDWLRLASIITVGLMLLSAMLIVTIGVSAIVNKSSSSFVVMLVVWVLFVMVIPRASVLLAGRAVDVPNIDAMNAEKSRYRMQLFREDQSKMADFRGEPGEDIQKLMQEFQVFMGDLAKERQNKAQILNTRLNERYNNANNRRQKVALRIAHVSPVATSSLAMMDMANTSLGLQHQFKDQARAYKKRFDEFLEEKNGGSNSGFVLRMVTTDEEEEPTIEVAEMPRFEFSQESAAQSVQRSLGNLLRLFGWNIIAFLFAWIGFTRSDIK